MHLEILTNLFSAYNIAYEEYLRMPISPADSFNSFDFTIGASYVDYKEQAKEKAKKILSTEISRCNHEKIFFRGCNFKNYEHNYINRLNAFLCEYDDSSNLDFIDEEIIYYENSLFDIHHKIDSCDGKSKAGIENFKYLNRIVDSISFKQFKLSIDKIISFLHNQKITIDNKKEPEKYIKYIWFKVGLEFAKGNIHEYLIENKSDFAEGYSSPEVARKLGNIKYDKYILASVHNYENDKNIFKNKIKMERIIEYCTDNNINVADYFLSKLPEN
jgi:hypothetical protein